MKTPMTNFDRAWDVLRHEALELDLLPSGPTAGKWASRMQERGYILRLHGDLLNKRIVDTLAIYALLLALLLAGCTSVPAGERFMVAAWAADSATTVGGHYVGLVEVGPVHQGQDVAFVVAFDMAILWGLHRAYKRWPDWPGWPVVWWVSGSVKGLVALMNLEKILAEAGQ